MKKRVGALLLAVALLVSFCATACAAAGDERFSDVSPDAWYAASVDWCQENGLMTGVTGSLFEPEGAASRAMLVTILHRQEGAPAAAWDGRFSDVPAEAWYSGAVTWAAENGILSGYDGGVFGADDPVTREQLAAILWRYADRPAPEGTAEFSDRATISAYAAEAAAWAGERGVVGGKPGNRFDPQGVATRAELAAMLHRWLDPDASAPTGGTPDGGRVLVAYFSRTGNTQDAAEAVAELTGGDLFELVPEHAYPTDYDACLAQARQELAADGRPALTGHVADMDQYAVIYLGFPIWHGTTPMPVRTFLEEYDLSGKTLAPFSTSGSSGVGPAVASVSSLCPDTRVTEGLSIPSDSLHRTDALVKAWVDGLGLSGEPETAARRLAIEAGGQTFIATLADTPTTRALLGRLPLTVRMEEQNGNEKYAYLEGALPTDASRPGRIQAGDLMLYGSDCLVLFYEGFESAYSYTNLGRIDDPEGLAAALGLGSVEVTFRAP